MPIPRDLRPTSQTWPNSLKKIDVKEDRRGSSVSAKLALVRCSSLLYRVDLIHQNRLRSTRPFFTRSTAQASSSPPRNVSDLSTPTLPPLTDRRCTTRFGKSITGCRLGKGLVRWRGTFFHRDDGGDEGVCEWYLSKSSAERTQVKMGFYIGINGCSLKTDDNLEVVKAVPIDRILLETGESIIGLRCPS